MGVGALAGRAPQGSKGREAWVQNSGGFCVLSGSAGLRGLRSAVLPRPSRLARPLPGHRGAGPLQPLVFM